MQNITTATVECWKCGEMFPREMVVDASMSGLPPYWCAECFADYLAMEPNGRVTEAAKDAALRHIMESGDIAVMATPIAWLYDSQAVRR